MTAVRREFGLAGAARASGPTVVVDVFRAFTTAAFALAGGVGRLVLAAELDEARRLADRLGDALLVGEEGGHKPEDFDLGNSPAELLAARPEGATVVLRSSAGTRAVRAALAAGAGPVLAASLVVASATARVVAGERRVTLVAADRGGREPAEEDRACVEHLAALLGGLPLDPMAAVRRAFAGEGAERLRRGAGRWAHPADLGLCLALDLFEFAMVAEEEDGLALLRRAG